jgi:hypothetical protein
MSFAALQIHHQDSMQNLDDGTSNSMHSLAFSATLADNEVFHYGHTMKQPDRAFFITAMVKEVEDLTKAGVWKLRRKSEIGTSNLVNAIWSFKRKRAPDGTIIKHKARLCAHGGMQIEGEHFWETYSPVVQMTAVRLLLTLSLLLNLKSRSIDFILAFTQAPIDVETYIRLPVGFSVEGANEEYVLELKKTLYGLKQAGLNWYETLREHLMTLGFKQSTLDPCCYMNGDLILLCYVDDCLLFCHDEKKIDKLISDLSKNFLLTDEGDVAAYLGVHVNRTIEDGKTHFALTQPHLIQ